MIFHVSIEAEKPRCVAEAIATIWSGTAWPLDRLVDGSWIAYCGSDALSAVEVFPLGTNITRSEGAAPWSAHSQSGSRPTASHVALSTRLTEDDVRAVAVSNGWTVKYVTRGDRFGVIEMWVSDHLVIEWLTVEMQARYKAMAERMVAGNLNV